MRKKLKEIWGKTDDIVLRYPMILTMALIAAISAVTAIEMDNHQNQFSVVKVIFTGCLGISLMFAVKMLSQRIGKGLLLEVAVLIFLVGFYFILPQNEKDFTEQYAFLLIPTYILSHLLVSFIPFFDEKRELNFWQYNKNLFINLFLTAVFTGVLVGGVMLAILAVDKLFDLNFNDDLYPKTFAFLAILGSSFIFLLFNDNGLPQLEKDGSYPQILKFFTQFVLIPLLIIYSVILYFYSAKILINWELPRGWVSYLILAYSVVGILALLLVHPLKEEGSKSWVKVFSKIFYYTLIPLIVLLFVAIFTRILEYGYTEPRYYVLILAIWLSTVVFYFVFFKNATIKFIPVSLFIFGIFALVFPYFNAFSVAKRSQKSELEKVLKQNNLLENGKINFAKRVSNKTVDEISDKIVFLNQRKEHDFVFQFLDENAKKKLSKVTDLSREYDMLNNTRSLFTNVDHTIEASEFERVELAAEGNFQNISGYQYMMRIREIKNEGIPLNNDRITIYNRLFDVRREFSITLNGNQKLDFTQQILNKINTGKSGRINVPEISVEGDLGKYHVKIYFENLVREKVNSQKETVYFNDGYLLIREK